MSSFTEATFEAVYLPNGAPKLRGGRQVYAVRGRNGDGLRWYLGEVDSGRGVLVPEGFETDGPSAPVWLLPLMPVSKMVKASALHDRMREDPQFTLLECDAAFLMAMEVEGTPWLWREIAFRAVRTNHSRAQHQPA